jgi:nucleotide-binding universal stress UspA family protein
VSAPPDASSPGRCKLALVAGVIVVGVDTPETSGDAIRWAADEARLRGSSLRPVHAWIYVPSQSTADPAFSGVMPVDVIDVMRVEREAAEQALKAAVASLAGDVPVEPLLVEDAAKDALVEASKTADLVVVGSHGRGGIASALLGSVSRHVAQHAHCPVVIVRPSSD